MEVQAGLIAAAFAAGLLSVFSPCILPLLPIYLGYFTVEDTSGRTALVGRLQKTLAFVAGVSTVFVMLGIGAGLAGSVLQTPTFAVVCGVAIVLMGVHQMGLIRIPVLERTKRLSTPGKVGKGLPGAYALGFFFSFGWTPCVGPILASILGVSLQQGDPVGGGILLLFYVVGFSIPFLGVAVASQLLLEHTRKLYPHLNKVRMVGGMLVVAMGIWMIAGQVPVRTQEAPKVQVETQAQGNTLSGEQISLSDWKGKTVYLKFWATWCPACVSGLREFQQLAQEMEGREDVVIYSVVDPGVGGELDQETFTRWASGQGLSIPVLFDQGGQLGRQYGIRAYPTSVFLDGDQKVAHIQPGHMENEQIREQLQTISQGKEAA